MYLPKYLSISHLLSVILPLFNIPYCDRTGTLTPGNRLGVELGFGSKFCSKKKCDAQTHTVHDIFVSCLMFACLFTYLAKLNTFKRSKNQLSGQ